MLPPATTFPVGHRSRGGIRRKKKRWRAIRSPERSEANLKRYRSYKEKGGRGATSRRNSYA